MAIDRKSVKFPAIAQLTEGWTGMLTPYRVHFFRSRVVQRLLCNMHLRFLIVVGAEIECLFNETALLTARKGKQHSFRKVFLLPL